MTKTKTKTDPKSKPKVAAKAVEPKAEKVGAVEYVDVPIGLMLAALTCTSTEETRFYLNGIFLHAVDGKMRAVATDGHRLLICPFALGDKAKEPSWAAKGIIVPRELLKQRLALIEQASASGRVRVFHARNSETIVLADVSEQNRFRDQPIDGKFPDYVRIIADTTGSFGAEGRGDFEPVGFDSTYLKAIGDIGKILEAPTVSVYASKSDAAAVLTFQESPGVVLYLMPKRVAPMALQTAAVLAPAIKGSIAALRAHETRNRVAAKDAKNATERAALEHKADEFKARIAAIMAATNGKALPAPSANDKPKAPEPAKLAALPAPAKVEPGPRVLPANPAGPKAPDPSKLTTTNASPKPVTPQVAALKGTAPLGTKAA